MFLKEVKKKKIKTVILKPYYTYQKLPSKLKKKKTCSRFLIRKWAKRKINLGH